MKKFNINLAVLEQIKVVALVVCAGSLKVIAYQQYRWLLEIVQALFAMLNQV
ncbi:hypothetical protein KEH51_05050 [[Brevibacterium] frigoritolerans]|uniref:Uncharacterized protein n=1 Tax=Peribacillus frigoritolerans TaxID=450367 RepID=A0A941FK30_9BACI|nr:hypothetical protein [Peribacillus frigoritolerans]